MSERRKSKSSQQNPWPSKRGGGNAKGGTKKSSSPRTSRRGETKAAEKSAKAKPPYAKDGKGGGKWPSKTSSSKAVGAKPRGRGSYGAKSPNSKFSAHKGQRSPGSSEGWQKKNTRGPSRGAESGNLRPEGFWAFGRNAVVELLEHQGEHVDEVYLAKGVAGEFEKEITGWCASLDLQLKRIDNEQLDGWSSGERHQGVAAQTRAFPYKEFEVLLEELKTKERSMVVILDQVSDPRNLGAIARSALAFGADALVVPKDRSAEVTGVGVKASAGALWRLPIVMVTNLRRSIEALRDVGYWTYGTVVDGGELLPSVQRSKKTVCVIGSEGRGIREKVAEACDFKVTIPMPGGFESLNASVAAGIAFYGLSGAGDTTQSEASDD